MAFWRSLGLLWLMISAFGSLEAQKQIDYKSDWGERRPSFPNQLILKSNVFFFHEDMTMLCDSAVFHTEDNYIEAFGRIHLYQDTIHLYGDRVYYDGDTKVAEIFGDVVRLEDGATTLKTDYLVWERTFETVRYTTGAEIWDEENTLTSLNGTYHTADKVFEFADSVKITSPKTDIISDLLSYETKTDIAFFYAPTTIKTSEGAVINTSFGNYNTKSDQAKLYQNNLIEQKVQSLSADTIDYNTKTECGIALGNVRIEDRENDLIIHSEYLEMDRKDSLKYAFLTKEVLLWQIDKSDTLHLHSDTLWVDFDSLDKAEIIRAYNSVRFFREDIQGVCGRGVYNIKDSTAYMLLNPVLWQQESSFTADTIKILTADKGIRQMQLYPNPFILQNSDTTTAQYYNQINGKFLQVDFEKKRISYAQMDNAVNIIYYLWEEEKGKQKKLSGVNIGSCVSLKMYFEKGKLNKMTAIQNPDFFLDDDTRIDEAEKKLKGFQVLEHLRPLSPRDIFRYSD